MAWPRSMAEADLMCALREISQEAAGEPHLVGKVGTSKA